jgi:hypothetical protein
VKRNSCSFFPAHHKTKKKNFIREKGSDPQNYTHNDKKLKKQKKKERGNG